jgi:light-regulated signal transduction histidine kinase (bacteriophytochrome)
MNRRSHRAKPEGGNENAGSPPLVSPTPETEAEIALYRHALENAREEFQAFAYSVSHDLRAPLRAIEGFSKILLEDFSKELGDEPRRFLQHIIANSQQLSSQIDDLLKFYRAGKNEPTKIDLDVDRICREALISLEEQLPKNVEIIQHELPSISADPVQLREIFSQLIANAVKFTSKTPHPRIEIGAKVEPMATTFFVRDNGVGFDPRSATKLFQVFQKFHSSAEYPGNGIGLAIVRRYVEAHGGCISADAEPGKGAVFCFSLPHDNRQLTEPPRCVALGA